MMAFPIKARCSHCGELFPIDEAHMCPAERTDNEYTVRVAKVVTADPGLFEHLSS